MPDLAAGAGIQRIALVGGRDVHDAARHHRRHLQTDAPGSEKIHLGARRATLALLIWASVV